MQSSARTLFSSVLRDLRTVVTLLLALLAARPGATSADIENRIWFTLTPAVSDGTVTVSLHFTEGTIQGWALGLCHDPEKAKVSSFAMSDELRLLNQGGPPDFYISEVAYDAGRAGIIQAVVLAYQNRVLLPQIEGGFPVLKVNYQVQEESSVGICSGLSGRGKPVEVAVTDDGATYRPSQLPTGTLIKKPYAQKLTYRVDPPESGEVVTVKLVSQEVAVEGWSFALCHTAESAEVVEISPSPEVEEILNGEPPDFLFHEITPAGPFVAVRQSVLLGTALDPIRLGPFPGGLALLGIRYRVSTTSDIKFCDGFGSALFDNQVSIDGIRYQPRTRLGATLVQGALGTRFVRGDADLNGEVDITDPIITLAALFLSGSVLPCLDAADSNDVGPVDISDPIFTLRFLFLGGEPPPAPFPKPGEELHPVTALGCERGF